MAANVTRIGALLLTATLIAQGVIHADSYLQPQPPRQEYDPLQLCEGRAEAVAVTCFVEPLPIPGLSPDPNYAASVLLFRDTPDDSEHVAVAVFGQTGTVSGLAFDPASQSLFTASHARHGGHYVKGYGAIFRIETNTGVGSSLTQPVVFATIPGAGPTLTPTSAVTPAPTSQPVRQYDLAGKAGLGDIELDSRSRRLFVANLAAQDVWVFDVDTGVHIDTIPSGATGLPWAVDARLYGLAIHDDRLYQGIVQSGESTGDREDLVAHVFSSDLYGGDVRSEVAVPLGGPRGVARVPGLIDQPTIVDVPIEWQTWRPGYNIVQRSTMAVFPQPLVADIEFTSTGDMVIGLRDRQIDMTLGVDRLVDDVFEKPGIGVGEYLLLPAGTDGWDATAPVLLATHGNLADRTGTGGLAAWHSHGQLVAGNALLTEAGSAMYLVPGAIFFDQSLRQRTSREVVTCARYPLPFVPTRSPHSVDEGVAVQVPSAPMHSEWAPRADLGDMEIACLDEPTPTPTATATSTPTPTITPSPTPSVHYAYLPIAISEKCTPDRVRVDVVLVIDASSSMEFETAAGRPKIDAAKDAARAFLAELEPNRDRAALVWFNAEVGIASTLSSDLDAVGDALADIDTAEYTRIHLGIRAARELLENPERSADNAPVMIILTDGKANPDPVDLAISEAAQARDAGATIFTIGLGRPDDLDADALVSMASSEAHAYRTVDAEDLAEIYRSIAVELPCPGTAFWPEHTP